MVLYVFLVDTGSMLTFDMNLAVGTVSALKEAIRSKTGIAEEKQVLLMNGGEALAPNARVCSYSAAGTDTSPIFLFNKSAIEQPNPPAPLTDYGPDVDLKDRVESCISMEPTYNTVVARTEMAKQMSDISMEQVRVCEKLVHDQHLQHQGWRAVVANLEDVISAFSIGWNHLQLCFRQFFEQKSANEHLLQNFRTDLQTLALIPLLTELGGSEGQTLFDWIDQKDHQKDLEQVAEMCLQAVSRFDLTLLNDLRQEAESLLTGSGNADMKEIRGLEERLYGLEKLMAEARKLSAEEADLSNALCKNQQRLANIRDPSIIPDLCKSHKTQLQVMLKNHQQLRDYRRRCVQAKRELSLNLHQRLRWIMFVEKKLAELDEKVLVHRENIRRLRNHMEIVQQIHLAPKIYASAVEEVVRRRIFSKQFQEFASSVSTDSSAIFNRETLIRQDFAKALNNHFLATLFPGFGDSVPCFAVEAPLPFDTSLPMLEQSHVQLLRQLTPQLFTADSVTNDLSSHLLILQKYFSAFSGTGSPISSLGEADVTDSTTELLKHITAVRCAFQQTIAALRVQQQDCGSIVKSYRDEVSSTVQEVESKLNQLVLTVEKNHDKERQLLQSQIIDLTQRCVRWEKEGSELESKVLLLQAETADKQRLAEECNKLQEDNESQRRIILEHEVDMVSVKEEKEKLYSEVEKLKARAHQLEQSLSSRESEMRREADKLAEENKLLKDEVDKLKVEWERVEKNGEKELLKVRETCEAEKAKELKGLRDKMKAEHKQELENLRIRFRLSSSVERAQDSLTMEPVFDRDSVSEQLASLKDKLRSAEKQHMDEINALRQQHEEEVKATKELTFNSHVHRLTQQKDREMQQLKTEIKDLKSELRKISAISPIPLSDQAYGAMDPETKVARLESIIKEKDTRIAKLQESLCCPNGKVAMLSCDVGDLVLLRYAAKIKSYIVLSLGPILHFLHSDSVDLISQHAHVIDSPSAPCPGETDNAFCLALVTEKEFCQAKKQQNRYNVDIGTRFYRVKARPWKRGEDSRRSMTSSVSAAMDRRTDHQSSSQESDIPAALSASCFPQLP